MWVIHALEIEAGVPEQRLAGLIPRCCCLCRGQFVGVQAVAGGRTVSQVAAEVVRQYRR